MKRTVDVPPEGAGKRLDAFLSETLELTRSAVQKLCDEDRVTLAGAPLKKNHKTAAGERYEAEIPEAIGAEVKIHSKRKIKEIPFYGDDIMPGNALFKRFVLNPDTKAGIRLYEKNK